MLFTDFNYLTLTNRDMNHFARVDIFHSGLGLTRALVSPMLAVDDWP